MEKYLISNQYFQANMDIRLKVIAILDGIFGKSLLFKSSHFNHNSFGFSWAKSFLSGQTPQAELREGHMNVLCTFNWSRLFTGFERFAWHQKLLYWTYWLFLITAVQCLACLGQEIITQALYRNNVFYNFQLVKIK